MRYIAFNGEGDEPTFRSSVERAFGEIELLEVPVILPRVTIADQDATPTVDGYAYLVTANTVATTITDFDDGVVGQEIVVEIGDANTTVDFTASGLKGNTGVDWTPGSGDFMRCIYNGTEWLCSVHEI